MTCNHRSARLRSVRDLPRMPLISAVALLCSAVLSFVSTVLQL
jgi:hypothetical protein